MESHRWQRIKDLFSAAAEQPTGERRQFVAAVCPADEDLQQEVESLLEAHERGACFLETPLAMDCTGLLAGVPEAASWAGRSLGPYRLLRALGVGGMGTVYLAERADEAFRKQVAIKLIRPGLRSPDILQRFARERQTLADLDHPNIAKLFDGGTAEDGTPYFVMEYVDGLPIDRYCDEVGLTIRGRVELFLGVCAAVQAAHRGLVIHRDIKPSNILVTSRGEPKLVDFGIAKLLANEYVAKTPGTTTVARLLTPQFASPEQIRGESLTTSSDIYSLGVLLYRLLTGKLPYELQGLSWGQLERRISEQEPLRPGIACDLDQIVLLALQKVPQQRYLSADALADDLQRWLRGEAVRARPLNRFSRVTRWCGRHRALAASLALSFAIFLAAFALVSWQWWRAAALAQQLVVQQQISVRQAAEAQRQAAIAKQRVAETMRTVREFAQFKNVSDMPRERLATFSRILAQLQATLADPPPDPQLKEEMAATCFQVARIGIETLPTSEALGVLEAGTRLYEELAKAQPGEPRLLAGAAKCLFLHGSLAARQHDNEQAIATFERSRELFLQVLASDPVSTSAQQNLIALTGNMATMYAAQGDKARAKKAFEEIVQAMEVLQAQRALGLVDHLQLADTYVNIAELKPAAERLQELAKSMDIRRRLVREYPHEIRLQHHLAQSYFKMGAAHQELGDRAAARRWLCQAEELMRQTVRESPLLLTRRTDLAEVRLAMGQLEAIAGDYDEAEQSLALALEVYDQLVNAADPPPAVSSGTIACLEALLDVHLVMGDAMAAAELALRRNALVASSSLSGLDAAHDLARCHAALGHGGAGPSEERLVLRERCAAAAVQSLERALQRGATKADIVDRHIWEPLQSRPDFPTRFTTSPSR